MHCIVKHDNEVKLQNINGTVNPFFPETHHFALFHLFYVLQCRVPICVISAVNHSCCHVTKAEWASSPVDPEIFFL